MDALEGRLPTPPDQAPDLMPMPTVPAMTPMASAPMAATKAMPPVPAMTTKVAPQHEDYDNKGNYILLDDDSVDVNTHTRDAYSTFHARNSPIQGGPPRTSYQPSNGPCCGQTHVQSTYCPSVTPTRDCFQRQMTIPETFSCATRLRTKITTSTPPHME
jgi:hypothetical protein